MDRNERYPSQEFVGGFFVWSYRSRCVMGSVKGGEQISV